jgi:predicted DNA binding protein
VVELSSLTTRQRELARFAAERGYFDPDGPAAETVAAELDIAKATLSEHLRRVQREVASQLFSE